MTVNSLVAASHLLVPIQSSYFALEGTDDLLETVEKIRARANPTLEFLRSDDGQLPRGGVAPAGADPVVLLRARGDRRPARNRREDPGARQPHARVPQIG